MLYAISLLRNQENLSFLKMLAQSKKNFDQNNYKPLSKSFQDLKKRINIK